MTLPLHVFAGAVGLCAGYLALYSTKGAPLHRRAGTVFIYTMLVMCASGTALAIGRGAAPTINVPAAILTAALVISGVVSLRPASAAKRRIEIAITAVTFIVGVASAALGLAALQQSGSSRGFAYPLFLFAIVAFLASAGDVRLRRLEVVTKRQRTFRHLWRMSFALALAALSLFVGQAQVFPQSLRAAGVLPVPVVLVLVSMFYWMWRVRPRGTRRLPFEHPHGAAQHHPGS